MISLGQNSRGVVTALAKASVDFAGLTSYAEAIKNVIEAIAAYRHPDAPPLDAADGACLLLQRAAVNAVMAAFQRHRDHAPTHVSEEEIATALAINPPRLNLSADDITAPESWPARTELRGVFDACLTICRMDKAARQPFLAAFDEEFPLALRREFLDRSGDYAELVRALQVKTPVDEAAKRGADWRDYRARLTGEAIEPMRSIDKARIPQLSLQAMYVPLRAVWEEKKENQTTKHIVWLEQALRDWVEAANPDDWVRVVTGGPGYGKSSVCKIFAADLARAGRRALLIPLGRLDYHGRAEDALRDWCRDKLGHNPLEPLFLNDPPLVLILDGLDELVKVGQIGEQAAQGFVADLSGLIARRNENGLRVLLLLAGRPGAVETAERLTRSHPGAWLEAQKFVIRDHRFGGYNDYDDTTLAELDQRDEWWRRYGRDGLPDHLKDRDHRLDDATAQPLLNWLLAQVLTLEGEDAAIADVHQLYEKLLHHVLARSHRAKDCNEAIDKLDELTLAALLEEVAAAAWHDGDRSVAYHTIQQRLSHEAHRTALESLCADEGLAIRAVLDSFFCTPRDGHGKSQIFEFTHKSFREFLTARRLLREMTAIVDDRRSRSWRDSALKSWFDLCGPTAISKDLLTSLRDAAAAADDADLTAWRDAARELLNHTIHHGFALPSKGDWTSKELDRQARNAEEALLAVHSVCAMALRRRFPDLPQPLALDWGPDHDGVAAGQWIHRMIGCWAARSVAFLCLNNCNLSGANLSGVDLFNANLSNVDLSSADLSSADLSSANLSSANFSLANLPSANLSSANLYSANLYSADLHSTNFSFTNLSSADLSGANFSFTNLSSADLSYADLSGAKFNHVRGISKEELAELRRRAAVEELAELEEEEDAE